MKNMLLLCVMLTLVFSMGCGKKEDETQTDRIGKAESSAKEKPRVVAKVPRGEETDTRITIPTIDPVSKEKLTRHETTFSYYYNNTVYYFKNEENLKTFKENPEKYITDQE